MSQAKMLMELTDCLNFWGAILPCFFLDQSPGVTNTIGIRFCLQAMSRNRF
ncbi:MULTISPECIES: hypothetical protein [unclassified Acetobacterium]|uniref:hypothetical protein n=1 Tax=unclassified Acetobacterium TaxID=2638182 RepID=UPI0013A6D146|nr:MULTISPECIES: hypothetical protein [unclassified Acetobacterium]MDZ5726815.1 hypothetical protein [Acetobacterium sp. K1/6]